MKYYVYIMTNKAHRLYIGFTVSLEGRVWQHKTKAIPRSYTSQYNFYWLAYYEVLSSRPAAKALTVNSLPTLAPDALNNWPRMAVLSVSGNG